MAVGYHKLNTSSARQSNRKNNSIGMKFAVTAAGVIFNISGLGAVETIDDFVSDCDIVKCRQISTGKIEKFKGGIIRAYLN